MEYIIILTLQMQSKIETFIVALIKLLRKARCKPYFKILNSLHSSPSYATVSHLCRLKKGYPRKHSDPEATDKVLTISSRDHLFRCIEFFIFTVLSIALLRVVT